MHGFSHQFPTVRENATKLIVWGKSGKLKHFVLCEIHGFPHQFPIAWENAAKSFELGEPRKLLPILPPTYGYFSSIRFTSYAIFIT